MILRDCEGDATISVCQWRIFNQSCWLRYLCMFILQNSDKFICELCNSKTLIIDGKGSVENSSSKVSVCIMDFFNN